jgi:L-cystine transport system substrate-binding protein
MKTSRLLITLLILCLVVPSFGMIAETGPVQKIIVGTEGVYSPFNFFDESGNLTGYDIDVVKAIDELLEEYEFDFVAAQWDSLFLGLESGKYDLIADQISRTPLREEKYLFTDNGYFAASSNIIVSEDNNDVQSMDDLKGKIVGASVGTTFSQIMEDYNEEHDNAFTIQYYEGNITNILQDIESGRVYATINDKLIALENVKQLGLKIKTVGEPVRVSNAYFVFRQDEGSETLKNRMDEALAEMIADGTLAEISVKWFGEDLSQ